MLWVGWQEEEGCEVQRRVATHVDELLQRAAAEAQRQDLGGGPPGQDRGERAAQEREAKQVERIGGDGEGHENRAQRSESHAARLNR